MKRLYVSFCALLVAALFSLGVAAPAFADDQQKAEKQLHKITAMATDGTGRRIVSMTVADTLGAKRADLTLERRTMNLTYGNLFLTHALVSKGAKMEDIAAQLKAKKTMADIANDQHADWKQIATDAKKLNARMEDNLYKHFLNDKGDADRDAADKYDPAMDGIAADNEVSKEEIAEAETSYLAARGRAEKNGGKTLDTTTEKAAREMRGDPIGKSPSGDSKSSAPN